MINAIAQTTIVEPRESAVLDDQTKAVQFIFCNSLFSIYDKIKCILRTKMKGYITISLNA